MYVHSLKSNSNAFIILHSLYHHHCDFVCSLYILLFKKIIWCRFTWVYKIKAKQCVMFIKKRNDNKKLLHLDFKNCCFEGVTAIPFSSWQHNLLRRIKIFHANWVCELWWWMKSRGICKHSWGSELWWKLCVNIYVWT